MIILAHADQGALEEMVENVHYFCPDASLYLYNSGLDKSLGANLSINILPLSRSLSYAKITPFFFDVFEYFSQKNIFFDYLINLETDLMFIRKGYEKFIEKTMADCDYMAPNFVRFISKKSKWRPYRSLRPELRQWNLLFGFNYVHGAFSPAQVFSRNYIEKLLTHRNYSEIKYLVRDNKSYTLQEILFPTLVDFLAVRGRSYPLELKPIIRYRPYQAIAGVNRALMLPNGYFVHPVRRRVDDAARLFIKAMLKIGVK